MTRTIGDDSPQSRMLIARNAAEVVLYGIREIPTEFDRAGVAATIQQAIFCIYRALDAGADSLVQPEALARAASLFGAAREGLLRTSKRRTFQINRAADILSDARTHAQAACEAVSFSQLDRRMDLPWGQADAEVNVAPFRASFGRPALHALRRDAVEPRIDLGEAEPEPEPEIRIQLAKKPESLDELKAMAHDLFAAMKEPPAEETTEEEAAVEIQAEPPPSPAELERQTATEIARDAIEDIGSLGALRHPIETESWLDQAPFEQRLLNRLDHFASLGVDGLGAAVLYYAESETPDPDRAFALAFGLGCVDGFDTLDAVITTIRQSPPETYSGFVEGLVLATNPHIDGAMRTLLGMNDPKLVALAVEVLSHRRALTADDLGWASGSNDARVHLLVAQSLGANLPKEQACERLEKLYTSAESGSELHLAALESGVRRCHPTARLELRRLLGAATADAGTGRAAALLGICGNARDFECLIGAAQVVNTPLALEGVGRFGHVGAMSYLLHLIDGQDETLAPAAAKELERITGAGLFDIVEEPWVMELPPEAAGMDVPIPMKKVRRISTNPERWRVWERANGQRFEPTKKYRAGVPFAPPQLLAELEALEPRSDERERSSLELCAATGQDFGFRTNDWVLGQQHSFARMREYFERHSFEGGAWCFSGAGIRALPERTSESATPVRRENPAPMPWQFDVVLAAEQEKPAEPVVERAPVMEGQDEIPDFLRASRSAAPVVSPGIAPSPVASSAVRVDVNMAPPDAAALPQTPPMQVAPAAVVPPQPPMQVAPAAVVPPQPPMQVAPVAVPPRAVAAFPAAPLDFPTMAVPLALSPPGSAAPDHSSVARVEAALPNWGRVPSNLPPGAPVPVSTPVQVPPRVSAPGPISPFVAPAVLPPPAAPSNQQTPTAAPPYVGPMGMPQVPAYVAPKVAPQAPPPVGAPPAVSGAYPSVPGSTPPYVTPTGAPQTPTMPVPPAAPQSLQDPSRSSQPNLPPPPVVPAEQKRPVAPATYFDLKIADVVPGLKPLKKLPWEK